MSTFKIEDAKFLEGFFPEWNWKELPREAYEQVLQTLQGVQDIDKEVAEYLKERGVKIGFHKQYKSGGGWTLLRNITLSPGDDPMNPYVLSLIIHETFHLKQSLWERLSMQGELRAWQYQKRTYRQLTGRDIGDAGQAYAGTKAHWDEIGKLDPESRTDLERAQAMTKMVSPDYRSHCLPLLPLPQEFRFYWRQREYVKALQVVWNLITCR